MTPPRAMLGGMKGKPGGAGHSPRQRWWLLRRHAPSILMGSVAAGRCDTGAVAESSHLIPRSQAESVRLGLAWALETSEHPSPKVTHSSNKAAAPDPSQTVLSTGDQALERVSLNGPFSSKPPHGRKQQSRPPNCNAYEQRQ